MQKFICAYCGYSVEFNELNDSSRRDSLQLAAKHEEQCEANPLVKRINELTKQLKDLNGWVNGSMGIDRHNTIEDAVKEIRTECSIALIKIKEPGKRQGYININRILDRHNL